MKTILLLSLLFLTLFCNCGRHNNNNNHNNNNDDDDDDDNNVGNTNFTFENKSPRIFLILSSPRSGTNMMEDFLDSAPLHVVACESEIMLHYTKNIKSMNGGKNQNWKWADYQAQLMDRLRDIRERNREKLAVGVTIMYGQGAQIFARQLVEICQRFDIPVIHLMRRNKLRMIISRSAMRYEGQNAEAIGHISHGDNIGHGKKYIERENL